MTIDQPETNNNRRRTWFILFSAFVSVTVFTYLFSTVSPAEVIELLQGITLRWILLFLLFSFSMSFFRTWRYQVVLNASGYRPDTVALFLITLVRNFFSDLLPARLGTLIYIYLVQSRLGIPFGPAASSFAYAFIFDMVSLSLLIILAVVVQTSGFISPAVMAGGALVLGLVSFGILLILPFLLRLLAALSLKMALLSQAVRQRLHDGIAEAEQNILLARTQGIYWKVFALSLGVRCCKYLSLYVLLLALVLPLGYALLSFPLAKVFLGLCSAELAASLPISGIAGFGAYEGAWALVFQLLGYPERIAVLTSISHHLLTQVYGYSLGAFALLILLLPMFKKDSPADSQGSRVTGRMFWPKLAVLAGTVLLAAVLLFPGQEMAQQTAAPGEGTSVSGTAGSTQQNHLAGVSGAIVYQRPDGIYTRTLNEGKPDRVVGYGSYPRWSPDGTRIVFVHANTILLTDRKGRDVKKLATAKKARAVCFMPDGKSVLFTDGNEVKMVALSTLQVTTLVRNNEFREIDISASGKRLAATVRTPLGLKVRVFDLPGGGVRNVANGCSASLSPDGNLITVNGRNHERLFFHQWQSLQRTGYISAPPGLKFDNQYWANHPHWVVSTSEGDRRDIFVHHVPSNTSYRVTTSGDCDRADFFVSAVRS